MVADSRHREKTFIIEKKFQNLEKYFRESQKVKKKKKENEI